MYSCVFGKGGIRDISFGRAEGQGIEGGPRRGAMRTQSCACVVYAGLRREEEKKRHAHIACSQAPMAYPGPQMASSRYVTLVRL